MRRAQRLPSGLRLLPLCIALLWLGGYAAHGDARIWTTDAHFDEGVLINLNHDAPNNDQLQLNATTEPLPFIAVAASARGTVVRINTETGQIIGEYRTAPVGRGLNPSRTTVDLFGNVWTGNRGETGTIGGVPNGSVVKIGLIIGGTRVNADGTPNPVGGYLAPPYFYNTCIDRDGDGLIRTSIGLGDILDWPDVTDGTGGATGLVEDAVDECILIYQRTPDAELVRHVSVEANNDVWVSGYPGIQRSFLLLDGETGAILDSFDARTYGAGGYGGLIDANGVLWSASLSQNALLRYDTVAGTGTAIPITTSYGLGIDTNGYVWNSMWTSNSIAKISPAGVLEPGFPKTTGGASNDRGVAITPADNHVWIANSGGSDISRLDNAGNVLKVITVGSMPTGVAVDANGKVWVTNLGSDNVMRIDPNGDVDGLGAVDLTVSLGAGAGPYNYSDMTGAVAVGTTAQQGTWNVVYSAGCADRTGCDILWNDIVPAGTFVDVEVRAANTQAGLTSQAFVSVFNGERVYFTSGQFWEIRVSLSRDFQVNDTPVLFDITIDCGPDCNNNCIRDDDDIASGFSPDCNNNGIPDECDVDPTDPDGDGLVWPDCNKNGIPDACDVDPADPDGDGLVSADCQPDGIPDECQLGNCLNQYPDDSLAWFSDIGCANCGTGIQIEADQFLVTAATNVTGLRYWGAYLPGGDAAVFDKFTCIIRQDAAGLPGAAVASFGPFEADTKLGTAMQVLGVEVFEYTAWFNAPVVLGPGTYWVEIYNDTSGNPDDWVWLEGLFDPVNGVANDAYSLTLPEPPWFLFPGEHGLQVYCDTPDNDCNSNGVPDDCEPDCNNNGIPDDCETKPEYDPTVAIPHKQCQDADFVCPDILYLGSTTPLGPGTSLPLTCSFYFGVFDTYYAYRPAWDGLTFIRVEGPPTQFLYAVHEGCPAGPQNLLRCNESNHFELVFDAKKGETYYIRIAGVFYTYGDFEMELVGPDCLLNANDTNANGIPDECECLQDVDGNGVVDMADYIAVLIAFGPCAGCPEDVDGDGNVDDSDAIEVFLNQGPCPFPGPMPPAQDLEQAERGSLIGAQPQRQRGKVMNRASHRLGGVAVPR